MIDARTRREAAASPRCEPDQRIPPTMSLPLRLHALDVLARERLLTRRGVDRDRAGVRLLEEAAHRLPAGHRHANLGARGETAEDRPVAARGLGEGSSSEDRAEEYHRALHT